MSMNANDIASRVLIVGLPAAVALCAWGLSEIVNAGQTLERVLTTVEEIQSRINRQDGRINRLENQYFSPHP